MNANSSNEITIVETVEEKEIENDYDSCDDNYDVGFLEDDFVLNNKNRNDKKVKYKKVYNAKHIRKYEGMFK